MRHSLQIYQQLYVRMKPSTRFFTDELIDDSFHHDPRSRHTLRFPRATDEPHSVAVCLIIVSSPAGDYVYAVR